ncbi:MAG: YceI family protein [Actinobacteria bacterium]|nr:YceI family protein [Actinomycetota bacterium]
MTITERATAPTRWTVETVETSVGFDAKTFWGLVPVRGRFSRFDGSYTTGPDGTAIELTVDAESIDTGNAKRDEHLRSGQFFAVAEHPFVRFSSTRVRPAGDGVLHVEGDLEAAGKVVPVAFDATVRPLGGALDIAATTTVDSRTLGMSRGVLGMIRPAVTLHVQAVLERSGRG